MASLSGGDVQVLLPPCKEYKYLRLLREGSRASTLSFVIAAAEPPLFFAVFVALQVLRAAFWGKQQHSHSIGSADTAGYTSRSARGGRHRLAQTPRDGHRGGTRGESSGGIWPAWPLLSVSLVLPFTENGS